MEPADAILDELIDRNQVIDRFDATYLDDLPEILRELHGVTDQNARVHPLWPKLDALWLFTGRPPDAFSLSDLGPLLVQAGVDPSRHAPRHASRRMKHRFGYDRVRIWKRAVGLRVDEASPAVVNELQAEFSCQSGGAQELEFVDLARPETGDPWTPFIHNLVEVGTVSPKEPVLTIGPRWKGEIIFFREKLGLRATIGLDLFSSDESLVRVGDMHDMPFDSDTVALVYQRNTFNKSYDIRAALQECVRVLRSDGVLVTDDCYDYTDGVSELARTNIKHNACILRALGPSAGDVLYDREEETDVPWMARVGQLAVTIVK
jgi:hypothetical protein